VTPTLVRPVPTGQTIPVPKYPTPFMEANTGNDMSTPGAGVTGAATMPAAKPTVPVETLIRSMQTKQLVVASTTGGFEELARRPMAKAHQPHHYQRLPAHRPLSKAAFGRGWTYAKTSIDNVGYPGYWGIHCLQVDGLAKGLCARAVESGGCTGSSQETYPECWAESVQL